MVGAGDEQAALLDEVVDERPIGVDRVVVVGIVGLVNC